VSVHDVVVARVLTNQLGDCRRKDADPRCVELLALTGERVCGQQNLLVADEREADAVGGAARIQLARPGLAAELQLELGEAACKRELCRVDVTVERGHQVDRMVRTTHHFGQGPHVLGVCSGRECLRGDEKDSQSAGP
jgi:hypothetical protein